MELGHSSQPKDIVPRKLLQVEDGDGMCVVHSHSDKLTANWSGAGSQDPPRL